METPSSTLLSRWYEQGDEDAMARLVERHRPWLWRYARSKMSTRVRAFCTSEDVVQEALVQLLRVGPTVPVGTEEHFRGLIARMVLNRILDTASYATAQRRDHARRERIATELVSRTGPSERTSMSPLRRAAASEESNRVRLALELLDPEDHEVIRLHRYEGLAFAEVATRLDTSPRAANKRYERAVTRLGSVLRRIESGDLSEYAEQVAGFADG